MSMLGWKSTGWWVYFISFLSFSGRVPHQMWATSQPPLPPQPTLWGQKVSASSQTGEHQEGAAFLFSLLIFKATSVDLKFFTGDNSKEGVKMGEAFTVQHARNLGSTIWCSFPFKSKQTLLSCTIKFHVESKPLESKIMIMTLNPMIMATAMAQILVMNPSCSASLVPMGFSVPAQIIRLHKWLLNELTEFILLLGSSDFLVGQTHRSPPRTCRKVLTKVAVRLAGWPQGYWYTQSQSQTTWESPSQWFLTRCHKFSLVHCEKENHNSRLYCFWQKDPVSH